MSANSDHTHTTRPHLRGRALLDELSERRAIHPISSMDELTCDVFDSDEDLELFLASVHAARRADLG